MKDTKEIARSTRNHRKLHRIFGSTLVVFFFIIALTGLMLGWKKNSGGLILPKTEKGTSTDLTTWLSYDALHQKAIEALNKHFPDQRSARLDRIDARPDKGL